MAHVDVNAVTARDGLINESTNRAGIKPDMGLTVKRPMTLNIQS